MNDGTQARVWDEAARQWVRAHGAAPDRPWLVWLDGDLYGDFRTQPEQLAAVTEAATADGEVSTSHWDPEGYFGPGWTEPLIASLDFPAPVTRGNRALPAAPPRATGQACRPATRWAL